jgi:fumarate hydratase class II
MVTALNPQIGYDAAAEIAKEAFKSGKNLRQVIIGKQIIPEPEIDKILDPLSMT